MFYFKYQDKNEVPYHRLNDSVKIQQVLASHGHYCSIYDAYRMWDNYSDSLCAGWIILPENIHDVVNILVGNKTNWTTDEYDDPYDSVGNYRG